MTESLATLDFEKADELATDWVSVAAKLPNPSHWLENVNLARCYQSLRTASKPAEDAEMREIQKRHEDGARTLNGCSSGYAVDVWAISSGKISHNDRAALLRKVAELEAKVKEAASVSSALAIATAGAGLEMVTNQLINLSKHMRDGLPVDWKIYDKPNPPAGEEGGR